jgi:hypothetical protein
LANSHLEREMTLGVSGILPSWFRLTDPKKLSHEENKCQNYESCPIKEIPSSPGTRVNADNGEEDRKPREAGRRLNNVAPEPV